MPVLVWSDKLLFRRTKEIDFKLLAWPAFFATEVVRFGLVYR